MYFLGYEERIKRRRIRLGHVRIRFGLAEQFAMPFVGVPSRETITCVGFRREGAPLARSRRHAASRRSPFRVQSTRRRNRTAAGRYDVERIGKAVLEAAAALVSVAVAHTHFISEPCASFGDDLRVIDQFVIVRSLLVIEREIVAGIRTHRNRRGTSRRSGSAVPAHP